jgi:hypothetical protein
MVFSTQLFATMALPSQMALRERFNRF